MWSYKPKDVYQTRYYAMVALIFCVLKTLKKSCQPRDAKTKKIYAVSSKKVLLHFFSAHASPKLDYQNSWMLLFYDDTHNKTKERNTFQTKQTKESNNLITIQSSSLSMIPISHIHCYFTIYIATIKIILHKHPGS